MNTRLCYACVLEHAAARGQAVVGSGDGHGICDGCKREKRLYNAVGLALHYEEPIERRALEAAQAAVTPLPAAGRRPSVAPGFGWSLVLMAAALALGIVMLSRCAHGAPKQSFDEWCQEAIRKLPTYYEDAPPAGMAGRTTEKETQLTEIARQVALVSGAGCRQQAAGGSAPPAACHLPPSGFSSRQWAALLFAVGWHESTFSLRIHRGDCKRWECDAGKSRGVFQGKRHAYNKDVWPKMQGTKNTDVQVWAADQLLRRQVVTCRSMGIEGIFAAYMGKRCESVKATQARMATFGRMRP